MPFTSETARNVADTDHIFMQSETHTISQGIFLSVMSGKVEKLITMRNCSSVEMKNIFLLTLTGCLLEQAPLFRLCSCVIVYFRTV